MLRVPACTSFALSSAAAVRTYFLRVDDQMPKLATCCHLKRSGMLAVLDLQQARQDATHSAAVKVCMRAAKVKVCDVADSGAHLLPLCLELAHLLLLCGDCLLQLLQTRIIKLDCITRLLRGLQVCALAVQVSLQLLIVASLGLRFSRGLCSFGLQVLERHLRLLHDIILLLLQIGHRPACQHETCTGMRYWSVTVLSVKSVIKKPSSDDCANANKAMSKVLGLCHAVW